MAFRRYVPPSPPPPSTFPLTPPSDGYSTTHHHDEEQRVIADLPATDPPSGADHPASGLISSGVAARRSQPRTLERTGLISSLEM